MRPWQSRPYRIIVTGSRDWSRVQDRVVMKRALHEAITEAVVEGFDPEKIVIVTGDAKGADLMARGMAAEFGLTHITYHADWRKNGRAAGPLRNEEMARDGADLCLAFPLGGSRGTLDMMNRAKKHGIPVRVRGEIPTEWGRKTE